jgi:hypothetical protein
MKNRDITKDEINRITEECPPREKAFFTVMRQSGLPPHTIKQLKIKNLERILNPNTPIPCKINVPHEKSLTFIGEEAIKYLKQYLATRTNLTPESLLFTIQNNPNKEINTKDVSRTFRLAAQELEKAKKITYEVRRGKPSELRLYSLIKFYRKSAKYYLTELDNSSTPKDDEFYRKLYEEKAMPYLEIETPTRREIYQLKRQIEELETLIRVKILPVTSLFHELTNTKPEEQIKFEQRLKEKELKERELKEQKNIHDVPRRAQYKNGEGVKL